MTDTAPGAEPADDDADLDAADTDSDTDSDTDTDSDSDVERVDARAHLLPEEIAAGGSADAHRQARVILEDSDRRTEKPESTAADSTQLPPR